MYKESGCRKQQECVPTVWRVSPLGLDLSSPSLHTCILRQEVHLDHIHHRSAQSTRRSGFCLNNTSIPPLNCAPPCKICQFPRTSNSIGSAQPQSPHACTCDEIVRDSTARLAETVVGFTIANCFTSLSNPNSTRRSSTRWTTNTPTASPRTQGATLPTRSRSCSANDARKRSATSPANPRAQCPRCPRSSPQCPAPHRRVPRPASLSLLEAGLDDEPAWLPTRAISSSRIPRPISSARRCSRGKREISSNFHSHIPLVSAAHRHIAASIARAVPAAGLRPRIGCTVWRANAGTPRQKP